MPGNYSDVLLHESVAQVDTAAIADGAVTGAKIAADTITEAKLNGAKFTGAINTVTTTLTHSLGTTPTFVFVTIKDNAATGVVRVVGNTDATNAYFISTVDGTDIEAYALV